MRARPTRRSFVQTAGAVALCDRVIHASTQPATSPAPARLRKAILDALLPQSFSPVDRFRLAADLGFAGIEVDTPGDEATVEAVRSAADKAGVRIHSVMNKAGNWAFPLSSEKQDIADKGLELLQRSLKVAAAWQADCVLQVPAQVTPHVGYRQAWERSQRMIRRVLPLARELGVSIAIENVGNRFLLSPVEFARYVDEFADARLRAYFDVGNSLMLWGYPQDWLTTLGNRVLKVHLKDCKFAEKKFVPLGDGDVDWPAVRDALRTIGYTGFVTVEPNYASSGLQRGDRKALADLSRRMDAVLQGL